MDSKGGGREEGKRMGMPASGVRLPSLRAWLHNGGHEGTRHHLQDNQVGQPRGILGQSGMEVRREDGGVHEALCTIEREHEQIERRGRHLGR